MTRTPTNGHGELMSVQEVATVCGVHRETVYRWAQDGDIPAIRIGKSVFIVRRRFQLLLDGRDDWRNPLEA